MKVNKYIILYVVNNYGSGSDFLTSYGSGSGSTSQKVTIPTVPVSVPVPQRCLVHPVGVVVRVTQQRVSPRAQHKAGWHGGQRVTICFPRKEATIFLKNCFLS
jgi:hypothetical protein